MTALRRAGPGRVALELDGRAWRVVTDEVVVRAGLRAGLDLDRDAARRLARERRRAVALDTATRALARRDRSRADLERRLEARGIAPAARADAVATLERLGLVDDARTARERAQGLAARGWGDTAVAARLESEGIEASLVAVAVGELAPERERAVFAVGRVPDRRRARGTLMRRGFSEDTIEKVLGPLDD